MRIGVFGGTFDPPHIGHLILAAECCEQLELDQVLWLLTPNSPLKLDQIISPAAVRLKMVKAAIRGNPKFNISTVDLERPGPQYAVDSVRLLKQQHPGAELIYLIGGDSLHDLPRWRQPHELVAICDQFGVMRRPDDQVDLKALETIIPGLTAKVRFVTAPLLEISGKSIRQKIREGLDVRYYLPTGVGAIIDREQLYR